MARVRKTVKLDQSVDLKELHLDEGAENFFRQINTFRRTIWKKSRTKDWNASDFVLSWMLKPMRSKSDPCGRNSCAVLPLNDLLWLYMAGCGDDEKLEIFGKLLAVCRNTESKAVAPVGKNTRRLINSKEIDGEELAKHCTKSVLSDLLAFMAFKAELNDFGDSPALFRKLRSMLPGCIAECLAGVEEGTKLCAACSIDEETGACNGATLYAALWADKARYMVAGLVLRSGLARESPDPVRNKAEIISLLSLCQVKFTAGTFSSSQRIISLTSNRFLWSGLF